MKSTENKSPFLATDSQATTMNPITKKYLPILKKYGLPCFGAGGFISSCCLFASVFPQQAHVLAWIFVAVVAVVGGYAIYRFWQKDTPHRKVDRLIASKDATELEKLFRPPDEMPRDRDS